MLKIQDKVPLDFSKCLAETLLQGTVNVKRKGADRRREEDNIKEWTKIDFASTTRAAEDRTRWKWVVSASPVVPERP